MIFIVNLFIMFGFVYFAARGVRGALHHIKLMKYMYSNAQLRQQVEDLQVELRKKNVNPEKVIYLRKEEPKMKRITAVRK